MNRVRKVKPRATDIEFEAIWLHGSYARSIGREFFYCHDLSEAVAYATRRMAKAEPMATGFHVRKAIHH